MPNTQLMLGAMHIVSQRTRPHARAAGFGSPSSHDVAVMIRAREGLGPALFAGAANHIRVLDVRCKRPHTALLEHAAA